MSFDRATAALTACVYQVTPKPSSGHPLHVPSFGLRDGSDERCRNARIHGVRLHAPHLAPHLTSVRRVQQIFTFVLWSFVYICLQPAASPEKAEEHEGDAHLPLHKGSQNFGTSEVCLLACLVILVMIFSVPVSPLKWQKKNGITAAWPSTWNRGRWPQNALQVPVIPRDLKKKKSGMKTMQHP